MFTGIVEEIGIVKELFADKDEYGLILQVRKICNDIQLGDSVAVNGVCLTVRAIHEKTVTLDVMPETLRATTLDSFKEGTLVNVERSLRADGRFGGHFVSGHVDGTGRVLAVEKDQNALNLHIELTQDLSRYVVMKGSVAVDGTSLTVFGIQNQILHISLIPHTSEQTILGRKQPDDFVNIEVDLLMKYVEQLHHSDQSTRVHA
ncbi:riboflavin synthase [Bacillaceae bacterium SIJ1]|uniref:riboflavin synthase n=1 Tax=Litoribacterium kuwaitense TaxID=1398745 RepID=UPI0013ED3367|nr:riboflavin synthase [Litoribacterium kuwaitense]NGP43657.1 riboflavin synthase [Litoribacterium kuwaitense]